MAIWKRLNKRAVSPAISAVILTGAAIALGLAVLAWSQSKSSGYMKDFSEATDVEMARLKERLTVEYIHYDGASKNIIIYLLNCGAIDDVKIQSVYVRSGAWNQVFSSPNLKFLNGTSIPDQDLDEGEEGCLVLDLSSHTLTEGTYYYVRVVTERGSLFDSGFVA